MEGKFYKKENDIWYSAFEVRLPDGTILNSENIIEKDGWEWLSEPPFNYDEVIN